MTDMIKNIAFRQLHWREVITVIVSVQNSCTLVPGQLLVRWIRRLWIHARRDYRYRSGTVNSKSFVGEVLLQIKWNFELTVFELTIPDLYDDVFFQHVETVLISCNGTLHYEQILPVYHFLPPFPTIA